MSKKDIVSIVFTFKDGHTRVFSQENHGDDFEKIAEDFEETFKDAISDKKEVSSDGGDTSKDAISYKVLKDFGDVKEGEVIDASGWTAKELKARLKDGTIELVEDSK